MTKKEVEREWDGICYPVADRRAEKKGSVVEKVVHPTTQREAIIRLEKRFMWFWTIVGDDYFQSKSGNEVRRWAMHFLGKGEIAEWIPVIQVHADSDRYYGRSRKYQGKVEVDLERYWIAKTNAGSWRQLDWEKGLPDSTVAVAPEDRMAESKDFGVANESRHSGLGEKKKSFKLPYKDYNHFYLPYDEALWTGLLNLIKTINSVKSALETMLQTKEGLATIAGGSVSALMLKAGDKNAEPIDVDYEVEDD